MSNGLSIKRIALHQQYSVPLIILSETAQQTSLPLLEAMTRESLHFGLRVVVVCLERGLSDDIMHTSNTTHINYRLLVDQMAECPTSSVALFAELEKNIGEFIHGDAVMVVFDDIEPLLSASHALTLALLRNARHLIGNNSKSRILARFPRDIADQLDGRFQSITGQSLVQNTLSCIADAVIDIFPMSALKTWMPGWYSDGRAQPFVSIGNNDCRRGLVRLEHKRRSGKVGYELSKFEINEQKRPEFSLIQTTAQLSSAASIPDAGQCASGSTPVPGSGQLEIISDARDHPATNLSFNLSLTEKQRQDRASVELPYLEAQLYQKSNSRLIPAVAKDGGDGEIHYQLDDEDDWDEDDPDDDLEI
ncbi:hypothetical protein COEREDRAFT_84114 [Coemansia reversa NRRL 1564]|uniref:Elongator complex protein 5 n=1 Tax=Coemansia reversa (strain ATCC 12441 / NRRL 1564) TaxID=763665 RepID=A0A2G5BKA7_COERN|nr:hypothetical protein COEREDRAFT_84114 [Coemansia reversa NRRL 1564]|eukprot:PIA19464.1 hypothetical protein COEREDRAFT_84114 [Coemansia reversa NRRL 1564]